MASSFVLSYWNLNAAASGGARRIHALLETLGSSAVLIQPRYHHPQVATIPYPRDFGRARLGINWGMFNFYWPGTRRMTLRAIDTHQPALLVMTSIWAAPIAAAASAIPCVLDAHDVNALAIAERYGPNHAFTRLVRAREARALQLAHHVFCCSEQDRAAFSDLYGVEPSRISVAPNGVDVDAFPATAPDTTPDAFWQEHIGDSTVLLFMGKLDYQPNRAALAFLEGDVLPELQRRSPGRFRLLVTGGPVPSRATPPGVVYAGRLPLEQLRDYMARADLCLAPVFSGGGTRLKVLEYMAAGNAIVSTIKGAEGIACRDGSHLVLAEPAEFASQILALADDPERRQSLGRAAREFVREAYDWKRTIQPQWRKVFDRYLKPAPEQHEPVSSDPLA